MPPEGDTTRRWFDREPHMPYEARAGLTWSREDRLHPRRQDLRKRFEHAGRSLRRLRGGGGGERAGPERRIAPSSASGRWLTRTCSTPTRGFMQARNLDGSWAAPDRGWTEGDQWVYLFARPARHSRRDEADGRAGPGGHAKLDDHFQAATTATTTSRATTTAIFTTFAASPGKPRSACASSPAMRTRTRPRRARQ